MRATFDIEVTTGEVFTVTSDARDVRTWESEYAQSFFDVPWSATQAAQIAYLAGMRLGAFDGRYPSYKDFDADCVRLDAQGIQAAGNPTPQEATEDSYASSRSGSAVSRPRSKRKAPTS